MHFCDIHNEIQQLLFCEYGHKMSDELARGLELAMTEMHLKNREVLISYGKLDTNFYVLKSGIIRGCYFDGEKEKTYAFATPGTVLLSYHSYVMRQPSFLQFESCGESVVMKISKQRVDEMLKDSLEFAQWLLVVFSKKMYFSEFKLATINGTVRERYLSLLKNRPEIIARVQVNVIASYLGVTPTYLCRVKKNLQPSI